MVSISARLCVMKGIVSLAGPLFSRVRSRLDEGQFLGLIKPSLISLMVSVDVKHHVYLLSLIK